MAWYIFYRSMRTGWGFDEVQNQGTSFTHLAISDPENKQCETALFSLLNYVLPKKVLKSLALEHIYTYTNPPVGFTSWESMENRWFHRRVAIFSVSPEVQNESMEDPMFPPPIREKKTMGDPRASLKHGEKKHVVLPLFLCFFLLFSFWRMVKNGLKWLVTCLTSESFKSKIDALLDFPIHGFYRWKSLRIFFGKCLSRPFFVVKTP